ncbi:hypothetical protein AAFF_G00141930 [Aldrovandia affinis]|uniref:Uncharacterized protein n=1 Tax=Aldrovandia affinis TaxID=143900 RepID=A0AAD7X4B2_9TELE|nr:hypothetical protein AAFF_G00141930 [Aldrovandia affinis]
MLDRAADGAEEEPMTAKGFRAEPGAQSETRSSEQRPGLRQNPEGRSETHGAQRPYSAELLQPRRWLDIHLSGGELGDRSDVIGCDITVPEAYDWLQCWNLRALVRTPPEGEPIPERRPNGRMESGSSDANQQRIRHHLLGQREGFTASRPTCISHHCGSRGQLAIRAAGIARLVP